MLHNTPQAVAMGSNQHPLALFDLRNNLVIPERQGTGNGVLQALAGGQLVLAQVCITAVLWKEQMTLHMCSSALSGDTRLCVCLHH